MLAQLLRAALGIDSAPPPAASAAPASAPAPAPLPVSRSPPKPAPPPAPTMAPVQVDNSFFSPRSMQQFGIFAAGAGFVFISTLITRRSINRKKLASLPKFYSPSHAAAGKQGNPDGSFIAFEALNLATLNVMSAGIMTLGGVAWALDLSTVDELRERTRRSLLGEAGDIDEKAEREFEEWAANILVKFGHTAPASNQAEKSGEKPEGDKKN